MVPHQRAAREDARAMRAVSGRARRPTDYETAHENVPAQDFQPTGNGPATTMICPAWLGIGLAGILTRSMADQHARRNGPAGARNLGGRARAACRGTVLRIYTATRADGRPELRPPASHPLDARWPSPRSFSVRTDVATAAGRSGARSASAAQAGGPAGCRRRASTSATCCGGHVRPDAE